MLSSLTLKKKFLFFTFFSLLAGVFSAGAMEGDTDGERDSKRGRHSLGATSSALPPAAPAPESTGLEEPRGVKRETSEPLQTITSLELDAAFLKRFTFSQSYPIPVLDRLFRTVGCAAERQSFFPSKGFWKQAWQGVRTVGHLVQPTGLKENTFRKSLSDIFHLQTLMQVIDEKLALSFQPDADGVCRSILTAREKEGLISIRGEAEVRFQDLNRTLLYPFEGPTTIDDACSAFSLVKGALDDVISRKEPGLFDALSHTYRASFIGASTNQLTQLSEIMEMMLEGLRDKMKDSSPD